ncbi:MotA/TolQ/ExbB proton channel family protein, partial [Aestuariivita sp.]|uniref:MotA/TolQ/ExbB proton channel family protein n=1 Tax=Aestuariivita sp. TaxID=1872407 RepID=UPI00216FAFE8
MDIASLIGLIGALGMVVGSMLAAGGLGPFIDVASILIVFGGTFFAVMYKCTMPIFLRSFGAVGKAFMPKAPSKEELITKMVELSDVARKNGLMALENQEVPDKFFSKGLQMLVDGADESKLGKQISDEIKAMKVRQGEVHEGVRGWIDTAPAMGMIATLFALRHRRGKMANPKASGPPLAGGCGPP